MLTGEGIKMREVRFAYHCLFNIDGVGFGVFVGNGVTGYLVTDGRALVCILVSLTFLEAKLGNEGGSAHFHGMR